MKWYLMISVDRPTNYPEGKPWMFGYDVPDTMPTPELDERLLRDVYDESDYSYLADEGLETWATSEEITWAGEVTSEEFRRIAEHFGVGGRHVETMGTLGGAGGFSWAPAVAYEADCWQDGMVSFFVTPIVEHVTPHDEESAHYIWDRVIAAADRALAY